MRTRLLLSCVLPLALLCAAESGCATRQTIPLPADAGTPAPAQAPPAVAPTIAPPPSPPSAAPQSAPRPSAPPQPSPQTPAPPQPPSISAADRAYEEGAAALREGAYERSLERFAAALREEPNHPEASAGFDTALVALEKSGHAAYSQGKPEEAGKRWAETIRYLNQPAAKGRTYPFTRTGVQGQLNRLTAAQMEKGLLSYRKGDIPAAIAAWKVILAYDPDNAEAVKSIRTASTQLENLKKIPPKNSP